MKKDVEFMEIFRSRIVASNIFSKEEQKRIEEDYLLFNKCYCLGVLDKSMFKNN